MTESTTDNGPAGRFQRIEAALLRIEDKLDLKVDKSELDEIKIRMSKSENGETLAGKLFLQSFDDLKAQVALFSTTGSRDAKDALALALKQSADIRALQDEALRLRSDSADRRDVARNRRLILQSYIFSTVALVGMAVSLYQLFLK